jgi:hypothetical protein
MRYIEILAMKYLKSHIPIDMMPNDWITRNLVLKDWSNLYPKLSMEVVLGDAPELLG